MMMFRRIALLFLLIVVVKPLMAQTDYLLEKINTRLREGNCESAQKLYKSYKESSNRTDREIEQRISECLSGKIVSDDRQKQRATATKGDNLSFTVGGVQFTMVYVRSGTFTMGCTSEQGDDCFIEETPAHSVTLSSYYMGETEVTQELWHAVMGNNPSKWKGDDLPVENVSWKDAQEFIEKLKRLTGRTFRLPTEAEWEYAARGGSKSRGYKYSGSYSLDAVAWYYGNSGGKTHPVKGKQANELGLYDMSGNVYEWCSDWYGDYSSSLQRDPGGPSTGSGRVYRGGCWSNFAQRCRVSYRNYCAPSSRSSGLGFRLVFVP